MALLRVEYSSKSLEMNTSFQVFLPDEGDLREKKVIYLLHGLTDNCTGWTRYSSCERYARERDAALVIPEVQRSFYTDGVYGLNYFTWVSQELPQVVGRMFGLSSQRENNYVMGLSMGGYGALKCALTHPERYAGCGAFSSVADMVSYIQDPTSHLAHRERVALFGVDCQVPQRDDLFALLEKAEDLPPIYLSCGEDDGLYPMSNRMAAALEQKGTAFRYDHRPGAHTWDFWDQSLQDCLRYHFG